MPSLNDQSCCSGTTGRKKEAECRQTHRQGGSMVVVVAEAQWSPQWSFSGRYWSAKGGTMVVQGRRKRRLNWYTIFTTVRIFTGRPTADHCASILRPRRCVCLPPASFERPVSDRPPRRPLCDCFEYAQNFTATMASMAMSERPVYYPWTTKAFCLLHAFNGDLVSFVVAQVQVRHKGRSPCVRSIHGISKVLSR